MSEIKFEQSSNPKSTSERCSLKKGYKAFDADFRCRDFQYEVGQTYTIDEDPFMCEIGFHFCKIPVFVDKYYLWTEDTTVRFAEVESGETTITEYDKSVTNNITIIREIPREEFKRLCTGTFECDEIIYKFRNGLLHCDDEPAVEYSDGTQFWYRDGIVHRDDGPAVKNPFGPTKWIRNGKLHRVDGPALIEDGSQFWYQNGLLHRDDGPAVEHVNGIKQWYNNGVPL